MKSKNQNEMFISSESTIHLSLYESLLLTAMITEALTNDNTKEEKVNDVARIIEENTGINYYLVLETIKANTAD